MMALLAQVMNYFGVCGIGKISHRFSKIIVQDFTNGIKQVI
jgi:hypothetical protein